MIEERIETRRTVTDDDIARGDTVVVATGPGIVRHGDEQVGGAVVGGVAGGVAGAVVGGPVGAVVGGAIGAAAGATAGLADETAKDDVVVVKRVDRRP